LVQAIHVTLLCDILLL